MTGLGVRSLEPELMDGDGLADAALHARCLADLAQVNRVTLAHRPLLRWLRKEWSRQPPAAALSVLDVGSGHGDLLRAVRRLAVRERRTVRLTGIDLHPDSTGAARAATPPAADIAFHTTDLFDWFTDGAGPPDRPPREQPDYIVSSQMTHHLDDAQLVDFLRWLDRHARRGWFIGDLHRHWFAYFGFRWLARAAGWHRVVRLDGTLSIARSFTPADWHRLLGRAGLVAEVRRRFPFRLCVSRQVTTAAAGGGADRPPTSGAPR